MSVEERHLLNKIRFFEDMLLRSKDYRQQENIGKELTVMRIRLQKLRFNKMRTSYLDNRPCSVLEMIIALAIRLEEHIMDDPDIGNRTGQWFWDMIVSLGLGSMDDSKFDKAHAIDVIRRFLDRDYGRDGKGGLFTIEHCRYDMRDIEIWYQAKGDDE